MFVSELFALSAAICIALSGMLISELKDSVDVVRLARWQMLAAFAMTAAMTALRGGWDTIGAREAWLLAASSLFGIIIASTTYFAAIYIAGPRTTALLFTLASPFSLLLGYAFLGETITMRQGFGVLLVLAGISMAIGLRKRETVAAVEVAAGSAAQPSASGLSPGWLGVGLGVVTALGQALGSLTARPAMEAGVDPAAAMAVRSGIAALFFLALALVPLKVLHQPYTFRRRDMGIAVASAFFGTGLGMSLLMAALVTGNVGIVTTLSSMTPIMILPMVWLRTGVAPVKAAWLGAAIAVAGTAAISL